MPGKRANVKNEKQYEALKDKGMSKERAAKIANSPGASRRGGRRRARVSDATTRARAARPRRRRPQAARAAAPRRARVRSARPVAHRKAGRRGSPGLSSLG